MIEKFNFFDVYAYLLPGAALLGLIWLPFGILTGTWPPADLSSALLFLVAAYIAGHVLYRPAKDALPTETVGSYVATPKWRKNTPSHPSDFLLDAGERTFPKDFKEGLREVINTRFRYEAEGVDAAAVRVNTGFNWDESDPTKCDAETKQRGLAFLLCRSALATGGVASYGEQFEGLYQLLRCLTVVFGLGSVYHLGWVIATWNAAAGRVTAYAAVVAFALLCLLALDRWTSDTIKENEKRANEEKDEVKRVKVCLVAKRLARTRIVVGPAMLAVLLGSFLLDCSSILFRLAAAVASIAVVAGVIVLAWGSRIIKDRMGNSKEVAEENAKRKKLRAHIVVGLFTVALLASSFLVRYASSSAKVVIVVGGVAVVCATAMVGLGDKIFKAPKLRAWIIIELLMMALLVVPFVVKGASNPPKAIDWTQVHLLGVAVLIDLFICLRCFSAFKPFAAEFAKTIYRDFYVYATSERKSK